MALSLLTTKILLVPLWLFACYSTWYLLLNNGAADDLARIKSSHPILLPGTNQPAKTSYTGISAIDNQLLTLAIVFWDTVDGSKPHSSLFAFMFAGPCVAAWSIMMVEGSRSHCERKVIMFTALWGLSAQNAGFACTIPIWAIVHLSSSTTSSRNVRHFIVDVPRVTAIPISVTMGFVGPAVLMSLPAPSVISYEQKQIFMAIWQIFPLTTVLLQQVLAWVISSVFPTAANQSGKESRAQSLHTLRMVYLFALVCASVTRIATITLISTSKYFPGLFAAKYQGVFDSAKVLSAASITPATKMKDIGDGNLQLLQYDEMVSGTVLLLWSTTLYLRADTTKRDAGRWAILVLRGIGTLAFAGPLGVVILCLWARDELVFSGEEGKDV